MFRKGLVCGIIVLVLGMSITPMAGGLQVEKLTSITSPVKELNTITKTTEIGLRGFNITLTGTMGENGWYVSCVAITITADNGSEPMRVYYSFDNGTCTEYTAPITVCTDGIYCIYILIVDQYGNEFVYGPFCFRIDRTPPLINMTVTKLNLLGTKWLVSLTVSDATSGVGVVEIYIDDALVGTITAPPWEFILHVTGRGRVVEAVAYDIAGNSDNASVSSLSLSRSTSRFGSQQINQLLHNLIYNLILHHKTLNRIV